MIYIGIDPDVTKSGVACWNKSTMTLTVQCLKFFELFTYLKDVGGPNKIIIEAGWLNKKSNYHGAKNRQYGELIAKHVGRNHEVGMKIAEMCEFLGLKYELYKPDSAKTTPEYFERLTGIKTKSQEKIDAAMLVFQR